MELLSKKRVLEYSFDKQYGSMYVDTDGEKIYIALVGICGNEGQTTVIVKRVNEDKQKGGMNLKLLSIKDVCDQLSVSRWTVTKLVDNGQLKASKLDKLYRFRQEDIDDYLNRNVVKAK